MLGAIIALSASLSAQSAQTDFGVRLIGVPEAPARAAEAAVDAVASGKVSLSAEPVTSGKLNLSTAAALGAHWGRVTSTYRSPEHNREVGGVPNSYHLLGRAIDIARGPGVNHGMIKEAYLRAGYTLVESLDEGDHSHFAFSWGPQRIASYKPVDHTEATQWKIVYAPAGGN